MRYLALLALLLPGAALAQPAGPYGPGPCPMGASSCVTTATGGTTSRTLAERAADAVNVKDYGAVCDGTTDDTTAITAALATGKQVAVTVGAVCYGASVAQSSVAGALIGPGQIKTSDGNKHGLVFTGLSTPPSSFGSWSNPAAAWTGDLSHTWLAHEHVLSGTALGQPASGYLQHYEASADVLSVYNTAGWNNSTSISDGRTGGAGRVTQLYHYGQGDLTANMCFGTISSTRASATSWLADPTMACLGGAFYAGMSGAGLEGVGDLDFTDNSFDIWVGGSVFNFYRENATEANAVTWMGDIRQSQGSKPIDAFYRGTGPAAVGIDFSSASMGYSRLSSVTLNSGGSGYTNGDILTISGGTAITPTKMSATVSGGVITAVTIVNTGLYSVAPLATSPYAALAVTGGTGSGVSLSGAYDSGTVMILPANGGCIKAPGAIGAVNVQQSGYNGSLCLTSASMQWGAGNTAPTASGSNDVAIGTTHLLQGTGSFAVGTSVYDVAQKNAMYFSGGAMSGSGQGSSQTSVRIFRGSGTSAFRMTTDQAAAGGLNSYQVRASSASGISFRVVAIDTSNGDTAAWKTANGLLSRTAGGNTAYTGDDTGATAPDYSTGAGSTASLIVAADTTNQAINFQFTPPNAHTWHAQVTMQADQIQ